MATVAKEVKSEEKSEVKTEAKPEIKAEVKPIPEGKTYIDPDTAFDDEQEVKFIIYQ
jgi:hypothetical protein